VRAALASEETRQAVHALIQRQDSERDAAWQRWLEPLDQRNESACGRRGAQRGGQRRAPSTLYTTKLPSSSSAA
jgi:hypothetical protein